MPAPPQPDPPNRTVRVAFTGRADDAPWTNVMWLALTGSGEITHATLVELANDLYGQYHDGILPQTSTANALDRCQVVLWFGGEEFSALSSEVSSAGGIGGAITPAQVAAVISWPLAQHYRGGHPRTYVAGIPVSAYGSNTTWDLDWRSDLEDGAQDFHTGVETLGPYDGIATVELGTVSFVLAGAWRTPPVFRRYQSGATVDSRIDTQRRRLGPDRT